MYSAFIAINLLSPCLESDLFPLKFCAHRWCENVAVAKRALDIWPSMKLYLEQISDNRTKNLQSYKTLTSIKDSASVVPQVFFSFLNILVSSIS